MAAPRFKTYKPRAALRAYAFQTGDAVFVLPPGVTPATYSPVMDTLEEIPAKDFHKLFTPERKSKHEKQRK